jgi:hypothetical protein
MPICTLYRVCLVNNNAQERWMRQCTSLVESIDCGEGFIKLTAILCAARQHVRGKLRLSIVLHEVDLLTKSIFPYHSLKSPNVRLDYHR